MNGTTVKIVVSAKSAFGVLDAQTEKWFNPADKALLATFKLGKAYDVVIEDVKGKNGKTYSQIVSAAEIVLDGEPQPAAPKAVKAPKAVVKEEKTDWAAKDRSQLVGGRSHDAVELVAISVQNCKPLPEVIELYKQALIGVLKVAEEVK